MTDLTAEEVQQIRKWLRDGVQPATVDGTIALRLCETIDHLRQELAEVTRSAQGPNNLAEKLGGPLDGKVLWRGKTRPLTSSDPRTRSFVDLCGPAFDIPSGSEVAVVLTGEAESDD